MSERRYVATAPGESWPVYGSPVSGENRPYLLEEIRRDSEYTPMDIYALVPLAELEAMERERAEMLEALKKTLEWFREENILEPQELSSVVIERMDKAIARAEGTRE